MMMILLVDDGHLMNRYFDFHFHKDVVTIFPGEFYTCEGKELISTVLGSCIAVTIFDQRLKTGGMNHFMLAYCNDYEKKTPDCYGRFGIYAMELLINDLLKKGSKKEDLVAKVFGGSNVLSTDGKYKGALIGETNSKFAFKYLEDEGIPVLSSNTGGVLPRKIFYDASSSKVWLKHIRSDVQALKKMELSYLDRLHEQEKTVGEVQLF